MYDLDTIIESIINGNRRDALEQLIDSGFTLDDLFEELLKQGMAKEITTMYRIAINQGYLTFKESL